MSDQPRKDPPEPNSPRASFPGIELLGAACVLVAGVTMAIIAHRLGHGLSNSLQAAASVAGFMVTLYALALFANRVNRAARGVDRGEIKATPRQRRVIHLLETLRSYAANETPDPVESPGSPRT